ncbi:MAG: hypothetical protein HRT36_02470 [Alphaproteobacteria bacterium]|nr:hypothetical protein [Alphaproteobacteria bacterium]
MLRWSESLICLDIKRELVSPECRLSLQSRPSHSAIRSHQ